jgi:hypothetical protein
MEDKKITICIGHILNLQFIDKIWAFQFHFDRNSVTKIFMAPRFSFMFQFNYMSRSTKMFNVPQLCLLCFVLWACPEVRGGIPSGKGKTW